MEPRVALVLLQLLIDVRFDQILKCKGYLVVFASAVGNGAFAATSAGQDQGPGTAIWTKAKAKTRGASTLNFDGANVQMNAEVMENSACIMVGCRTQRESAKRDC